MMLEYIRRTCLPKLSLLSGAFLLVSIVYVMLLQNLPEGIPDLSMIGHGPSNANIDTYFNHLLTHHSFNWADVHSLSDVINLLTNAGNQLLQYTLVLTLEAACVIPLYTVLLTSLLMYCIDHYNNNRFLSLSSSQSSSLAPYLIYTPLLAGLSDVIENIVFFSITLRLADITRSATSPNISGRRWLELGMISSHMKYFFLFISLSFIVMLTINGPVLGKGLNKQKKINIAKKIRLE